jgi:hypothetical protein
MSKKIKKVTAKQFSSMIGISNRGKFYVNKMLSNEKASLKEWSNTFIKIGLIEKEPSIVTNQSSNNNK